MSLLHYDDSNRYELSSSGKTAQFYASATIAEAKSSLQSLRVEYDGNASYANVSLTLSVFNWRTGAWQAVDRPRSTGTTADRQFAWTAPGVSDYVSSTGAVRFRVDATRNNSFLLRTDLIRFTVTY